MIVPIERDYCDCYKNTILKAECLCPHCGVREENCICGEDYAVFLPHFTAPFYYDGLIKAKLHDLKFNGRKNESRFFFAPMAKAFSSAFPDVSIDLITFVPMTRSKASERGFNQSRLLAEGTAKLLSLPCADILEKTTETEAQHSLDQKLRLKNLHNCFSVKSGSDTKGKTILLVDDIKTTGKTLSECASTLLLSGADDVYCLCAAATYFSKDIFQ